MHRICAHVLSFWTACAATFIQTYLTATSFFSPVPDSALTVAVPPAVDDVRMDVTCASPAGILTGESISPMFVSRTIIISSGTGAGVPFSSYTLIVIMDFDLPSAGISVGSDESLIFISNFFQVAVDRGYLISVDHHPLFRIIIAGFTE